jgi:hypothetical protein
LSYASNPMNAQARFAASAASHISTVFVFNTFRQHGQKLAWSDILQGDAPPDLKQMLENARPRSSH